MGFFDWVKEKVSDAIDWVKDKFRQLSEDVSKSGPINENSSIDSMAEMSSLLRMYSDTYKKKADGIENECKDIVAKYFNYVLGEIKKNEEIRKSVEIQKVEQEENHIEEKINGAITSVLKQKLSLDNRECLEILKLPPESESKKIKIRELVNKTIKDAHNNLSEEIKNILSEQIKSIKEFLQNYMTDKENTLKKKDEDFKNMLEEFNNGTFNAEKKQMLPYIRLEIVKKINTIL